MIAKRSRLSLKEDAEYIAKTSVHSARRLEKRCDKLKRSARRGRLWARKGADIKGWLVETAERNHPKDLFKGCRQGRIQISEKRDGPCFRVSARAHASYARA